MARAHFVKKARKDNSVVKKGESYYWWKFRFGGKHYSKGSPSRSQLTQSAFLGQMYDLEDRIAGVSIEDQTDAEGQIADLTGDLENLRDECQESLDAMPEHLQETSSSGELLTERVENVEEMVSELENIDTEVDELQDESMYDSEDDYQEAQDAYTERVGEIETAINDVCYNGG